jgi:hypothetical protein
MPHGRAVADLVCPCCSETFQVLQGRLTAGRFDCFEAATLARWICTTLSTASIEAGGRNFWRSFSPINLSHKRGQDALA